ncbi:MAG: spermidine synthase [Thermomicrobiales bacterium]
MAIPSSKALRAATVPTSTSAAPIGRVRLLEPLVFFGGLTSIGIELAASRLLAPYFGNSTFIWANLIGLTLTYLALGYYIGGRVADRFPTPVVMYAVAAVAAVFAGFIPVMSRPILRASLSAFDSLAVGAFYGSLLGVILLFAIPVTLLGFITPYAIRLRLADVDGAGKTAGRIYALSTVGSILGSFLPVLLFIPAFGTATTFLILSLSLLVLALLGLLEARSWRLAAGSLALIAALLATSAVVGAAGIKPPYRGVLIHEEESEYNYIQVLQDGENTLLALNEGQAIHSIYNPRTLLTGGPWDYFGVAPLVNDGALGRPVRSALMIGLAGGTASRELLAAYPEAHVDGVEIDKAVADIGRRYFAMSDPRLNVIIEDGRYFLRRTDRTYDIVAVDAYHQPYIPFQLTTTEFFGEVAAHLNPHGAAVVNVGRTATDFRLVDALATTMGAVFRHVYVIDVGAYTNSMVIGTNDDSSAERFAANAAGLASDSLLGIVASESVATGNVRVPASKGTPFTDDRAPVERVVDRMIIDAAREEGKP